MATGAAIAGVGLGIMGARSAKRASGEAAEARDLSAKQIRQTTDEEIRRKEYTYGRDISSIEAEIAAAGISATGEGLRGGEARTVTSVDDEFNRLTSQVAELQKKRDDEVAAIEADEDSDFMSRGLARRFGTGKEIEETSEKLTAVTEQRDAEISSSWNVDGGIFAEYLSERERVHFSEISWMKKTGLSSVRASMAEGSAAVRAAEAQRTRSYGQIIQSGANWWQASQPPATTTTTQQAAAS